MLDKILYVNDNLVVIYYTDRIVKVRSDNGSALSLTDEILAPFNMHGFKTRTDYLLALKSSMEDTVIIDLEAIDALDSCG